MKRIILFLAILALLTSAAAQFGDDQLAQTYSPVMKFNANENFFPAPADYHVGLSGLMGTSGLLEASPTMSSIASYTGEDYFLDNKLGWFEQIVIDYRSKMSAMTPTVYYHVARDAGYTAIQYWFFYAFNDGPLNQHEGDWEQIIVVLYGDQPVYATYSQHQGGEKAQWNDVEKAAGTHPIIYVGRGSHANYFRSYEGKFGLQNDDVGGDGTTIMPEQINLVSLDENPSWLSYGGRWGEQTNGQDFTGSNGPVGPRAGEHRSSWDTPVSWANAQEEANGGKFMLSWLISNFVLIFVIYFIIRCILKIIGIIKTAKKHEFQLKALVNSGFVIWLLLGIIGTCIVFIGIMMPWYGVRGIVAGDVIQTQGEVSLMKIEGMNGMQVNTLQKGAGMTTVFNATIPFGLLVLAGVIFTVLDLIGAKSGKKVGLNYFLGGLMPVVAFIIIIIVVASLGGILNGVRPMLGKEGIPPETVTLVESVAASPISGGYQGSIGGYSLNLNWGIGIGAYLMLIGGIMKIVAGAGMIASAPKNPKSYMSTPPQQRVAIQYAQQMPYYHQTESGHTMVRCGKCGSFTQNGDKFCQVCGTRVVQ